MQTRIVQALEAVLKQFGDTYYLNHRLNKGKVIEDLDHYDEDLVKAMLDSPIIKKHFTKKIGDYQIIEVNKLIDIFEMNDYWLDSQTKYAKKIGLTTGGRFLDEATEVVLDFPYKDTVLKAGMSKEDVQKDDLKPDEPFYNEVIAAEEIDVMLDKKILVNAKRYTSEGAEKASSFSEADNLILKGNNLLALHTLKEKYAGKVKLIYIDPPYYFLKNKDADSFSYNSNFKLSTWLTFMKNRLEIARDLLCDTGVIFISISEDGQAYLKLLMDDIFSRKNFVETFVWKNSDNPDSLGNKVRGGIEYIHAYEKEKNNYAWIGAFSQNDDAPLLNTKNSTGNLHFPENSIIFNIPDGTYTKGKHGKLTLINDLIVEDGKNKTPLIAEGNFKWSQQYLNNEINEGTYFLIKSKAFSIRYQRKDASVMVPEKFINNRYLGKIFGVGTNEDSNRHLNNLNITFSYSKPESLIGFLIRSVTDKNDLVLDFFMGSATTQAVAMKMNRRFIGIEQMDYINTISVPRLQKVIEGEQGGISKDVNWQGGGSFVYAELMEKSRGYIDAIYQAENALKLKEIYQVMLDNVSLDFKADLQSIEEMLDDSIALDEKKKLMIKVIDKNQLYYNFSEIDDSNVREFITESDYQFNQSFYQEDELNG